MGIKVFRISVDIPKPFDKSWHDGLIFKLCQNHICSEIINILKNFRSNRKQRVILNNQCLSWADIRAAATQGSLLGPSLFLIYINDLSNDINSKCKFLTFILQQLILIRIYRKLANGFSVKNEV